MCRNVSALGRVKLISAVFHFLKIAGCIALIFIAARKRTMKIGHSADEVNRVIGHGIALTLLAIFGVRAILKESRACLMIYIGFTNAIILTTIILAVMMSIKVSSPIPSYIIGTLNQYFDGKDDRSIHGRDQIQQFYECCGKTGPHEYKSMAPASCCKSNWYTVPCPIQEANQLSCSQAAQYFFHYYATLYLYWSITYLCMDVIILSFTWYVLVSITDEWEDEWKIDTL